jgi:hypothetical protein
LPLALIVPSVDGPPPMIDQVTTVFVVPDTVSLNWKVSPARMLAVGGDTTTLIEDGGGG